MRPAIECPQAHPITTQNLTLLQRTNSIRGRHVRNGRFFENLAAADTNDKAVLSQLTDNNTKLVNTNEELLASVKKLTSENRQLQQVINNLR